MTEKTEEEKEKLYLDNLKKTFIPAIFGIIGGIISIITISEPESSFGLIIVVLMILAQIPIYAQLGFKINEFKPKDWLYISFMTFVSWFVTWGLFLNVGA